MSRRTARPSSGLSSYAGFMVKVLTLEQLDCVCHYDNGVAYYISVGLVPRRALSLRGIA